MEVQVNNMTTAKQTCTKCPNLVKCWALRTYSNKPISTQNILINVLICRLQLGIDRDKAAANLIRLYRPGMIRLLNHAKQQGGIVENEASTLLSDIQATMIDYLSNDYKIGDRGRATPYLFNPQSGFLTKWVKWIVGRNRRFYSHHELYSPIESDDELDYNSDEPIRSQYATQSQNTNSWSAILEGGDIMRFDPFEEMDDMSLIIKQILDIVEDGVTLNNNEYRVFKFCLSNGNEQNVARHIDGLHISLSNLMQVSRPRITRLYACAKTKILAKYQELRDKNDKL